MPRRLSEAMATQSLPDMAIMAAPLYSRIDMIDECSCYGDLLLRVCRQDVNNIMLLAAADIIVDFEAKSKAAEGLSRLEEGE